MKNKNFLKGKKARNWGISLAAILIAAFVFLRFNSAHASNAATGPTGTVTTLNVA